MSRGPPPVGGCADEGLALDLEAGGDGGAVDLAGCAEVVVGEPVPELELGVADHRLLVEQAYDVLDLASGGGLDGGAEEDAGVEFLAPEGDEDPLAGTQGGGHVRGDAVGERGLDGEGE